MSVSVRSLASALVLITAACGGSGGTGSPSTVVPSPPPPPPPPPPPGNEDPTFDTKEGTSRFLSMATFGPTPNQIDQLTGTDASDWLVAEFNKPTRSNLDFVINYLNLPSSMEDGEIVYEAYQAPSHSFWIGAVEGDDQLRQRTAFALSQIFVISHNESSSMLFEYPTTVAHYQDVLAENAFGNFRDLLEDVTFSPAMGVYLTYWQNQAEDAESGRMPDENYAREVMQLFTIGLVDLNRDGSVQTGSDGAPRQTYDNDDVTGLAKVFTGISLDDDRFFRWIGAVDPAALYTPMRTFPEFHSTSEKQFLGTTISGGTGPDDSIDQALDALFNHPNVGPFIGRQLIQRFVTSNPSPAYIDRVAQAFESGSYTLLDGTDVGTGDRGDMKALIAAVLMDEEALTVPTNDTSGRIREPILRFVQWARAFDAGTVTPQYNYQLWNTSGPGELAQHPYKAASVFNFYRPGYVAPGTMSGAAGLTVPELQIMNASSAAGYANFMTNFIYAYGALYGEGEQKTSFIPDYTDELALASDAAALVDHLDLLLTSSALSDAAKTDIVRVIEGFPLTNENDEDYDGPGLRVATAVLMVMTSPDYIVQR